MEQFGWLEHSFAERSMFGKVSDIGAMMELVNQPV